MRRWLRAPGLHFAVLGALLGHVLFWCWNLLFLAVVALGIGPTIGFGLLVATVNGVVPWHFTAFIVALIALPIGGMAVGAWRLRRGDGWRL